MVKDGELFWKLLEPEYLQGMMFCRKLMGDRDEGDDLYQDALVQAFTAFSSLRDLGAFRSWLYRILINKFKSTIRRPWWKRRQALTPDIETQLVGDNPVELHTARRLLRRAFRAVSTEEQALITLYEMEGWSVRELAELHGTNEGAIKTRLFRARQRMKKALLKFSPKPGEINAARAAVKKDNPCNVVKPGLD
jgi:RNA polymerase sigma-70 factor (ECF subfamily)